MSRRGARGGNAPDAAFERYIALGDSMAIDRYPSLDLAQRSRGGVGPLYVELPIGAASLLYRNDDELWPEFDGRDLVTLYPGVASLNLASDGATLGDVFGEQIPSLEESEDRVLVTLTIGGNDLLSAVAGRPSAALMQRIVADLGEAYRTVVSAIRDRLRGALVLVTTVYDPTDRTGRLPGVFPDFNKVPLEHLDRFNAVIRDTAESDPRIRIADVHGHFLGHGVTVPTAKRWYWPQSIIEPGAEGASEIRRVWLEALERR